MFTPNELARFADVCTAIGNEVADDDGFVPVRKLLIRFHARLIIRPLLVEGMLASIDRRVETDSAIDRWAVLVDSETYPISEREIQEENSNRPLPSRFRNTIAHELAHSLAFRSSEFGIRLRGKMSREENQKELVAAIEQETERLSPLLLWPDKAIAKLLSSKKESLSIEDLVSTYRSMGVSRYLLISRLSSLRPAHNLRNRDGLGNIAIGLGRWVDGGHAVLKGWPVFLNFHKNITPTFLLRLVHQDFLPSKEVFPDESFAMCGGSNGTVEFETEVGITDVPSRDKMKIQCSIEHGNRKTGTEFLFVVRTQTMSDERQDKIEPTPKYSQLDLFS